jgi:hypothetical protein
LKSPPTIIVVAIALSRYGMLKKPSLSFGFSAPDVA